MVNKNNKHLHTDRCICWNVEVFNMAEVPTEIRIDENLKKQSTELFSKLGIPKYKTEVLEAMEEAKTLSKDPTAKRYSSFSEGLEKLEDDV